MWSWRLGWHLPERGTVGQLNINGRVTLGHESVETTQMYLDANLALKEQILAKTKPIDGKAGLYRPDDSLLSFLRSL